MSESKLTINEAGPIIKDFIKKMLAQGIRISVQAEAEDGGFQITSMSGIHALGWLKVAEIQITNGFQAAHSLDATVQCIENQPELAKRFAQAMHQTHEVQS